jgi:uncharacterized membrane protein YjjP (DUF1212 family)
MRAGGVVMDDFRASFRRVQKERDRLEEANRTPLQRAEMNRQEDVMLFIFSGVALIFVLYVIFGEEGGLLWVAVLSLVVVIVALALRFRRPLH